MDEARREELRQRDEASRAAGRPRARAEDLPCANCGSVLPDRPPRRHVPRRGGRYLFVCHDCANRIDEQTVLLARGVAEVDRAVDHYERITGKPRTDRDFMALMREPRAA